MASGVYTQTPMHTFANESDFKKTDSCQPQASACLIKQNLNVYMLLHISDEYLLPSPCKNGDRLIEALTVF